MAAVPILDFWGENFDHPWRVLDGLYRCTKFGWNRCSSFVISCVLVLMITATVWRCNCLLRIQREECTRALLYLPAAGADAVNTGCTCYQTCYCTCSSSKQIMTSLKNYNHHVVNLLYTTDKWGRHIIIISASLSINIASVTDLSPSPLACLSVWLPVGQESVLWQNGWLDPDAVWDGEWGESRDGCIRWGWWSTKGKGSFGVNLGRPIVTNGTFVAY